MSLRVIRFTASWCAPCRVVGPIMEELAHQYSGEGTFMVVDIDKNMELAAQKGITSVPTVIIEKSGVEVARIVGAKSKAVYENAIKS